MKQRLSLKSAIRHITLLSLQRGVGGEAFTLAIPSIISNITVPLLGLVDMAIVGHIGDARYIAAIAVGSMFFNVIYWIFGFLRMGTGGMTSQAYGRKDFAETLLVLFRTLAIGTGMGLLFIILQQLLIALGFASMAPATNIRSLASIYCHIVIWGAPAVLGLNGLTGWYVGMQNTKVPMIVSILQNIINIIASLSLVFACHLDIAGVAWGTVIAQWSGFLLSLLILKRYYRQLGRYLRQSTETSLLHKIFEASAMKQFFVVNRDIFVRTLFLVAVMLFFTSAGSRQGAMILAVNTLLMEFFTIFSYFSDGFAYAAEALGGKYYGARNRTMFQELLRALFKIGFLLAVLFTLLYIGGGRWLLRLLTDDKGVLTAVGPYFWWSTLIPVTSIAGFLLDGIFVGITNTKGMLASSVSAAMVFFLVYFVSFPFLANHGLWLAFILYLITRGAVEAILLHRRDMIHHVPSNQRDA